MTTHHVFLNKAYPDELALRRAEGVRLDEAYPVDLSGQPAGANLWRVESDGREPLFTSSLAEIQAAMQSPKFRHISEVEIVAG